MKTRQRHVELKTGGEINTGENFGDDVWVGERGGFVPLIPYQGRVVKIGCRRFATTSESLDPLKQKLINDDSTFMRVAVEVMSYDDDTLYISKVI